MRTPKSQFGNRRPDPAGSQLGVRITDDPRDQSVTIGFNRNIAWFKCPAQEALKIADELREKAERALDRKPAAEASSIIIPQ